MPQDALTKLTETILGAVIVVLLGIIWMLIKEIRSIQEQRIIDLKEVGTKGIEPILEIKRSVDLTLSTVTTLLNVVNNLTKIVDNKK